MRNRGGEEGRTVRRGQSEDNAPLTGSHDMEDTRAGLYSDAVVSPAQQRPVVQFVHGRVVDPRLRAHHNEPATPIATVFTRPATVTQQLYHPLHNTATPQTYSTARITTWHQHNQTLSSIIQCVSPPDTNAHTR